MKRRVFVLAVLIGLSLVGPACAGTFQGQMFNLNGTPVGAEAIRIQVFPLDQNNQIPIGSVPLVDQVFAAGTFAFDVNPAGLLQDSKATRIVFIRNGNVTRTVDGLLGSSARTQVIDVTVPDVPPEGQIYCCPSMPAHRHCRLFGRGR